MDTRQVRRISSEKNRMVREVCLLREKRYRAQRRLFFVEGYKFVSEAMESGWTPEYLFVSQSFVEGCYSGGLFSSYSGVLYLLPDKLFERISDTETPQGVLAVLKQKDCSLEDVLTGNRLVVILDSIQDPGNMGTIIRTADAAAFDLVIAGRGCVDFYSPKAVRSTAGSVFHIPVIPVDDVLKTVEYLRNRGIKVYSTGAGYRLYPDGVGLEKDAALVIGNEANGVSPELIKESDATVSLPIPGRAESLNASVAAAVMIYESVRQRMRNE